MLDTVTNKAFLLSELIVVATMKKTYLGEAGQSKLGASIPNICLLCIGTTDCQLALTFSPSLCIILGLHGRVYLK